MVFDGTLEECIKKFLAKPEGQRHLYEIHTTSQGDVVKAVISGQEISELARHQESP
jgi:hypothetical protein